MTPDFLLTPKQAARYLNLAEISLAKWRVDGTGPEYFKLGRAVRYRVDSLDAWLEERLQRSTSETRPANR
ncbi:MULTISPECIES: helix-turn-helix transcriptional regulator [Hyphobacterium]|uniref:Helix-turn-helix transcriptional regulator n=1 Tax=Hyphobacterium vulgare TaxID=1736751 RepID=A0ABV6ZUY6_9PROT